MEVIIIGKANRKVICDIESLVSEHGIRVHDFTREKRIDINSDSGPLLQVGERIGIKGFIEENAIIVAERKDGFEGFLKSKNDTPIQKFIDELAFISPVIDEPVKIQPYIRDYQLEYGYEHIFPKRLYIKRQEDIDQAKTLSSVHNHQSKTKLKQSHINGKPFIYRRHGVDNRR